MEKPSSKKSESSSPSPKQNLHESVRSNHFALKLHRLLSQPSNKDIMCWTSNGDAFCILNETLFVERIMSVHFQNAKFESFSRRLRRWGFKRIDVNGKIPKIHGMAIFRCEYFKKGKPELCKFICDERQLKNKSKKQTVTATDSPGVAKVDGKVTNNQAPAVQAPLKYDNRQPEVKTGGEILPQHCPQHEGSKHNRLGFFSAVAVAASEASSSSLSSSQMQPEQILPRSHVSQSTNNYQEMPQVLIGKRQHLSIAKSPVTSTSQIISDETSFTSSQDVFKEKGFNNNNYHFAAGPTSSLSSSPAMLPPYNFGSNSDERFMARSLLPRNLLPHDISETGSTLGGVGSSVFNREPDGHFVRRINPQIMEMQLHPHPHFQSRQPRFPILSQHTTAASSFTPRFEDTATVTFSNHPGTNTTANNTSYSQQLQLLQASIERDRRVLALRQSIHSCEEELALVSRLRRLKEEQIALQRRHQYYQHE